MNDVRRAAGVHGGAGAPRVPPFVGVSVSESAEDELVALGLSGMHLRHAFIEVVRHVLAAGWSVAYGGDLRRAGYTEALFDLVRTYEHPGLPGPERVRAYLAWPVWVGRTVDDDAELANVATLVRCPAPPGAPEALPPLAECTGEELLLRSLGLTRMREEMTAAIGARLVLGGRVTGQVGLLPGVLEEAALAVERGLPLYVAGGFGGCGRAVVAALRGERPAALHVEHQLQHTDRYDELLRAAGERGIAPDFAAVVRLLASVGMAGLRNGLTEADNRRLAVTDDAEEVTALVLRGLHQLHGT